jgi:hypothetical protein
MLSLQRGMHRHDRSDQSCDNNKHPNNEWLRIWRLDDPIDDAISNDADHKLWGRRVDSAQHILSFHLYSNNISKCGSLLGRLEQLPDRVYIMLVGAGITKWRDGEWTGLWHHSDWLARNGVVGCK